MTDHPSFEHRAAQILRFPEGESSNSQAVEAAFGPERPTFLHNVVGHPLLWLLQRWPALAHWVHDHTEPVRPGRRSGRG